MDIILLAKLVNNAIRFVTHVMEDHVLIVYLVKHHYFYNLIHVLPNAKMINIQMQQTEIVQIVMLLVMHAQV